MAMQTAEKPDTNDLLENPEIKAALKEIREIQDAMRADLYVAFDDTPRGELPDVSIINDRYEPRLKELGNRVREIVRSHSS